MSYRVKITKCSGGRFCWYRDQIGSIFVVDKDFWVIKSGFHFFYSHINPEDCEIIAESKIVWEPI